MPLCQRLTVRFIKSTNLRFTSTATQPIQIQDELTQPFRTKENNPNNHSALHLNRYYTIPQKDVESAFVHGLPTEYKKQNKTFAEMSILIRKPAVELIKYLSQTDYTKPVNKYVIYGESGCGKTSTLLHLLHYGYVNKKIIIHVQWAQTWFRFPKETSNSTSQEGLIDLPIDAAAWLLNFKKLNAPIITEANLKLSKTYEWSTKEASIKDSSLIEMIDFGISRVKYACDVLITLLSELKQASIAGKCKIFVAIDGYNAFFSNETQIKNDAKQFVPASKISLTQAFLDITKSDWCNGEIIVTVDQYASKERRDSIFPRYLLTNEGFDHLDPFLPIIVENYTQDEFDTVVEYYKNRKWIRNITPEGLKELQLITGSHPFKLMEYCKHL